MKLMTYLFRSSTLMVGSILFLLGMWIIFVLTPAGVHDEKKPQTTPIYFADNISFAHEKLIDAFNQEFQGQIEVKPINLPFTKFSTNERKELLARTLRGKSNRIDILAVDLIWVPRFAKWCQPLDRFYPGSDQKMLIPQALESCFWENKLFAIPFYLDVGMMYYRRDLIGTLPDAAEMMDKLAHSITWEEFIGLSKRFPPKQYPFYLFPADNYEGLICSFVEGVANHGQGFTSGNTIHLNTPESRKTVQLFVDLIYKYQMTPSIVTKYDEYQCYLHFLKNDGIFLRGWPGFLRHYRHVIEDTSKFKYIGKAPLPHFQDGQPAFIFGGWNLMISKNSTHTKEAMTFIRFLLRPENQKFLFQEGGYIPVVQAVYQDSSFLIREPDLLFYKDLMQYGVHRPYLVNYTKLSDIISYYLNRAMKKELSVSEALEQATHLINSNQVLIK